MRETRVPIEEVGHRHGRTTGARARARQDWRGKEGRIAGGRFEYILRTCIIALLAPAPALFFLPKLRYMCTTNINGTLTCDSGRPTMGGGSRLSSFPNDRAN